MPLTSMVPPSRITICPVLESLLRQIQMGLRYIRRLGEPSAFTQSYFKTS
jgi:hypothetical protein